MSSVRWDVDEIDGHVVVRLVGDLCLATVPQVRAALTSCLTHRHRAVLVDVSALRISEPAASAVFCAVTREALAWRGSSLVVCAPAGRTAALLSGDRCGCDGLAAAAAEAGWGGCGGRPTVVDSVQRALAGPPGGDVPRRSTVGDLLMPATGAARRARDVVVEACGRWGLPHLVGPAVLVTTELVNEAVECAGTMMDLQLVRGRSYLMILLRDGGSADPVPGAPSPDEREASAARVRLLLLAATAHRWGCLSVPGGRVVWAVLRTAPPVR